MRNQEVFTSHSKHQEFLCIQRWQEEYPWLVAGFTTRVGGVSEAPYGTLNCGLHVGDCINDVIENRKRVTEAHGFLFNQWVSANQTHGSDLYFVSDADRGKGKDSLDSSLQEIDAIYTNQSDIFLASFYADCVPLFFFDPEKSLMGLAHAGWKGTRSEIGPKLIKRWQEEHGSSLSNIKVAIGPSIGGCCYEVDQHIVDQFNHFSFSDMIFHSSSMDRYMLDLKKCNVELVKKAGIRDENIEISKWCTSCRVDMFYSHRKEKGQTGRMVAFIGMKEREK